MTRTIGAIVFAVALLSAVHVHGAEAQRPERPTVDEPLTVFGDVLSLTRHAVKSHWLVGRPAWKTSAANWDGVSAELAPEARGLTRCWPPVAEARGSIEEAHRLFERARRQGPDAYALFEEHKRLLADAAQRLSVAEECYRVFRAGASPR